MPDRPNILLLIDDEHRADVAGFAGNDVVRTPTLDWLADTGIVFENAYTPAPVCVPARHSIRTGQLPRTWDRHGFDAFESGYRTMARQFGEHGFMTASAGKMHYPGFAQMQGWRKRLGPTPLKRAIGDDALDMQEQTDFGGYGGFSDWKWSAAKEIKRAGVAASRVQVQDRRSVEGGEQFLKQYFSGPYYDRCQPDRPLVLQTSLVQPHYPFFTDEEELFTYYLNRVEPSIEDPSFGHSLVGVGNEVIPGEDAGEREIRRATAAYYAMIERVDGLFGRVIDALAHHGQDPDEWVIVFTSDHGEMLGERGGWGKNSFYEAAVRVPLVVRYPERFEPGRITENVNLCDLYATCCDLADVPVPPGLDSRSLVPLLAGGVERWHDRQDDETISQGASNRSVAEGVDREDLMIKRGDLKYCSYVDGEVLFDLAEDPGETTNYVDDPAYADELERFRTRRAELGYGSDADPSYETAGYDPGVPLDQRSAP